MGSTLMIPKAQQIFAADQQLWIIDVPGNTQFLCFVFFWGGGLEMEILSGESDIIFGVT